MRRCFIGTSLAAVALACTPGAADNGLADSEIRTDEVPRDACDSLNVQTVESPCDSPVGYYWDGNRCKSIATCACEGTDCALLAESIEICRRDHSTCEQVTDAGPRTTCASLSIRKVERPCDSALGYYWNGKECQSIATCECEGRDCALLVSSIEACLDARRLCTEASDGG